MHRREWRDEGARASSPGTSNDDIRKGGVTRTLVGAPIVRELFVSIQTDCSVMAMTVLVTGGTGVVGESAVKALHASGHGVRVLTRHAGRDEKWWPEGIEGWAGDVSNERSITGAAEGCDVILHIAGIVE